MSIGMEISRSRRKPRGYDLFPAFEFYPHLTQPQWAKMRNDYYAKLCGGKPQIGICDGCGKRKVVFPCNGAPLANGAICIVCLEK